MTNANARYEVAIFAADGTMETLYCNNINVIGGYFCDLDRAQQEHMKGNQIAFCYDREKQNRFYLRDIVW